MILFLLVAGHPARATEAAELRALGEAFRITSVSSYLKALSVYSTPAANLKLTDLDAIMWPVGDPVVGWRAFMAAALVNIADSGEAQKIIGFYHPWSDVMLVTRWAEQPGDSNLRIVDFDVLLGQALRGEALPYRTQIPWQSEERYPAEAVGLMAAKTAKAFEADAGRHWPAISMLRDVQNGEAQAIAASLLVGRSFATLAPVYRVADGAGGAETEPEDSFMDRLQAAFGTADDARAAGARDLWLRVARSASGGAPGDLSVFSQALGNLAKLPETHRKSFFPVSYLTGPTRSMLMLTTPYNPDLFVALEAMDKPEPAVANLGLYSFQSFYDLADQIEEAKP